MIAHSDEKVEEQFATSFHFHLHGTASLEGRSAADDQGEIVCTELGVAVGRVGVSIACTRHDGATLNTRLKSLFPKSETLEFVKTIFLCGTTMETGWSACIQK